MDRYEHRPRAACHGRRRRRGDPPKQHLIVEAGTGVGKSFAYLVPAILASAARRRGQTRGKVVISTHTISLQEQLMRKDIPFLRSVMPLEFTAVLVKGRRNYLSLRRLKNALSRAASIFSEPEEFDQLRQIEGWSKRDRRRLAVGPRLPALAGRSGTRWPATRAIAWAATARPTKTASTTGARRRVSNAQILVVNHALFFSDLALRDQGASILPDYDVVVFDEAHTMEAVAGDHLGLSVSSGQVEYLLNKLYNDRTNRGLLVHYHLGRRPAGRDGLPLPGRRFLRAPCRTGGPRRAAARAGSGSPRSCPIRLSEGLAHLASLLRGRCDESERSRGPPGFRLRPRPAARPWPRRSRTGGCSGLPRRPTGSRCPPAATAAAPRWPRPPSTSAPRCGSTFSRRSPR